MKKSIIVLSILVLVMSCGTLPQQNVDALQNHLGAVVFREFGEQHDPETNELYFANSIVMAIGEYRDVRSVVNGTIIDVKSAGETDMQNNGTATDGKEADTAAVKKEETAADVKDAGKSEVQYEGIDMGRGSCVVIQAKKGYKVVYGGITTTLKAGDTVTPESVIGKTGPNQESYTFNLAVLVDGKPVNPLGVTYEINYFIK